MTARGTASGSLISVIMPVWRPHPPWLLQAVGSVLAQGDCELELVVVDDGCDEQVASLLAVVSDARLRVIRIEHQGQGAALNAGIEASSGRWLRFVDSDDVIAPGSMRRLASRMVGDRLIAYGATEVCDEQLHPYRRITSTLQGKVVSDCLVGRFETRHVSMLFPRRVVEAAGPWDTTFRVSADWDFVLRALDHAEVSGDREVATLYRRNRRSVSGRANVQAGEESRRRIIARYFDRHPEQRGSALEREAWRAMYEDRGRAYWNAGQRRAAVARFAGAVWSDPLGSASAAARAIRRRLRPGKTRSVAEPAQFAGRSGASPAHLAHSPVSRIPSSSENAGE